MLRDVDDIEQWEWLVLDEFQLDSILNWKKIILDIDLDAFACQKLNTIYNPSKWAWVHWWQERLLSTKKLKKFNPSQVTIAQSEWKWGFTPSSLVPALTKSVMELL